MRQLITVILLLGINMLARSQSFDDDGVAKELGFSAGVMSCNTDIGGKIADIHSFKPMGGVYAALIFNSKVGVRLEGTIGTVAATDKRAKGRYLRIRNLDFTSVIKEGSLLGEIHPLNFIANENKTPLISPYILAGVGYFTFNPKTQLNGRWVYLQPLHTEGEGFPETKRPDYKLSGVNFPAGGGLQLNISERLTLRGEAVYRFLNTDYLDDVSTTYINPALFDKYLSPEKAALARKLADRSYEVTQGFVNEPGAIRGSKKKDAYYAVNIKLGIRLLNNNGTRRRSYYKRTHGCFSFQ